MKSPNIMSTTGRSPVIAAPTAMPVKPASEIGVSSTRSVPNSSTSPESTLKGVPASATSSPKMQTRASRRISSASASRTAWPKVSSREVTSGINVLLHRRDTGIRSGHRKLDRLLHLRLHFRLNPIELGCIRQALARKPIAEQFDGVALGLPVLLFFLGAVILAVDIAHMMTGVAIRIAYQE